MANSTLSLRDFAAAQGPSGLRPRCLLCNVPLDVEQQAQQGRQAKIPYRVICQWLESLDESYGTVTKGRIERHFYEGHRHPDTSKDATSGSR